jgi:hypothetical protein
MKNEGIWLYEGRSKFGSRYPLEKSTFWGNPKMENIHTFIIKVLSALTFDMGE